MKISFQPAGHAEFVYWQQVNGGPIRASCSGESRGASTGSTNDSELREVFRDFVGQTLFAQMLRSMRRTLGRPAYFHGGRFEEVFQAELDRIIVEKAARKDGENFADHMFELFSLQIR